MILIASLIALVAQTVDGHVVNSVNAIDIPGGAYTADYTTRGFWSIPNFLMDENFERECGDVS